MGAVSGDRVENRRNMHRNPPMGKTMRAIGLMSGTSMDGIDVALIDTDGEDVVVRGPSRTFAYDAAFRSALARAIEDARGLADRNARPGALREVELGLTERHAPALAQIAFDTGPGNALLDDWMARHTGRSLDADGQAAAAGRIDEAALTALLTHDYFGKLPPKSLDRNAFSASPVEHLTLQDGAATLT